MNVKKIFKKTCLILMQRTFNTNVDGFHKNPEHQIRLIDNLNTP